MADSPANPETKLPATPARQGALGKPVLLVLVVSTALAGIALISAWLFRADDLAEVEPHAGRQTTDATTFQQDAPAPIQNPAPDNQNPAPAN
ncbi:hypothetical protein [Phenylobacterium sp.]|uniref:hypothetical protein n=1 Tax=Phenylobacterium sp. TaxID=1871053 RepID=UPI00272F8FCB|nr:hypothetical protein [Phenylobacterium sp.]MDP1617081.1 hypothetical protein [Phenylobacterium sp.]